MKLISINDILTGIAAFARNKRAAPEPELPPAAVIIQRKPSTDHGTFGVMTIRGKHTFQTCEPPWRDNERNRSCGPAGRRIIQPHISPKYGRCLIITGVPNRDCMLAHAGNLGGDTKKGFKTHTKGCTLPGMRLGTLTINGKRQTAVLSSKRAMRHLLHLITEPMTLEILPPAGETHQC